MSVSVLGLSLYRGSLFLLTDLYQLTMAQGYWANHLLHKESVFHLFFRRMPFQGGFTVAAGLEAVIDWLSRFQISDEDLTYLSTLKTADHQPLFKSDFLNYLSEMRFTGHLDAVPEGTIVFPQQPLLRVEAPLIQAQLLETALLNLINFPTLIATKAARMSIAAQKDPVLEFGVRRAQGIDGALTASRAAYIGGCSATSNVLAGKIWGIPVKGTHSHSWVMAFDNEISAFEAYAKAMPNHSLFLVDTYDTLTGVEHAIEIGKQLRKQGHELLGIRLDSGDLAQLSIQSRELLDKAGFEKAAIVASNELDEILISELKRQGAKVNVWGVGTHLATGGKQPALDGVYKLSALRDPEQEWQDKIKLSEQLVKVTNPGILQVRRFESNGENIVDVMYDIRLPGEKIEIGIDPLDPTRQIAIHDSWSYQDLLVPIFRSGKLVYSSPSIEEIRQSTLNHLQKFSVGIKRFLYPHTYSTMFESDYYYKKLNLIKKIREQGCLGERVDG